MSDDRAGFARLVEQQVAEQGIDARVATATREWMLATQPHNYSYHFSWLGLPVIQYPPDIVAVQELIWSVKPDLVIETGIARGGFLLLSASILTLLDLAEARESGELLDPRAPRRKVVGVEIDVRPHNRDAIEGHSLSDRIFILEGSSVDPLVMRRVTEFASQHSRVMVLLDSNHTHDHVLAELMAYGPLVSPGSYCIVFDTIIDDMPPETYPDRPWGPGDNPMTEVNEFLEENEEFSSNLSVDDRLLVSVAR